MKCVTIEGILNGCCEAISTNQGKTFYFGQTWKKRVIYPNVRYIKVQYKEEVLYYLHRDF